jgi:hypothetical protein
MSLPGIPQSSTRQSTPAELGVLSEPKACGECGLCCKVLEFPELKKPRDVWCRHFVKGEGCGVHADRPQSCRDYQCTWTWAAPLDARWRPDRAGFVLHPGPNPSEVEIVVDPGRPDAWRSEPYYSQIKQWADPRNLSITRIIVRTGGRLIVVFAEADIDLGLPPPNDTMPYIHWGYEMRDGRLQPYARFATTPA